MFRNCGGTGAADDLLTFAGRSTGFRWCRTELAIGKLFETKLIACGVFVIDLAQHCRYCLLVFAACILGKRVRTAGFE